MYGPPGTGKTLSARAVANRTDATFIRVIGSELVQRYVSEGARMVRELFSLFVCLFVFNLFFLICFLSFNMFLSTQTVRLECKQKKYQIDTNICT